MRFADSHCHIADAAFDADRDAVVERAFTAGASVLIAIGESVDRARAAADVARRYPGRVASTAGVHPHDAAGFDPARDDPAIRELLAAGAVGVGECGLDYHYDHSPRLLQRRAFAAQLEIARDTTKPVVVHTRDADDDTAAMVREAGAAGVVGILHCHTGPAWLMDVAVGAGWYISFSGIVTFKKWTDDGLVRAVPADRLLVESDAPYLAPVPDRGKRNEPAWVARTLARVAEVRGVDAGSLGDTVVANTVRCFHLPPAVPAV